jgi:hypothetical protein
VLPVGRGDDCKGRMFRGTQCPRLLVYVLQHWQRATHTRTRISCPPHPRDVNTHACHCCTHVVSTALALHAARSDACVHKSAPL